MAKISTRQQRIIDYIKGYRREHGYAPSVRDIQIACDISSTSVVDYNLRILQREGVIRRSPDISRGLELVDDDRGGAVEVVSVPIIGAIAAGAPLPVVTSDILQSEGLETVGLPPELTPRVASDLYALRVKGYSMIDALIDDGDVVVLRRTPDIRNGDMVAAWLRAEEEATLKRLYREGDHIRLQPANVQMQPIVVPATNVEVHGKVVAVIRRLE
ncbi:MAG: transcriptional repressor LexA [SAR202 cluster bacterium]|nr:transcriptional repressor LexA [SAR202 cluster bacterium]